MVVSIIFSIFFRMILGINVFKSGKDRRIENNKLPVGSVFTVKGMNGQYRKIGMVDINEMVGGITGTRIESVDNQGVELDPIDSAAIKKVISRPDRQG